MPKARLQTITALIKLAHSLVDQKEPHRVSLHCLENDISKGSKACDDLSISSLVRQLRATSLPMELWPGSPDEIASLYPGSAQKLSGILQNMKCNQLPSDSIGRHEKCGFVSKMKAGVAHIEEEMPSGMNDSHQRHMATQRSKLDQSHSLLSQIGRPAAPEENDVAGRVYRKWLPAR